MAYEILGDDLDIVIKEEFMTVLSILFFLFLQVSSDEMETLDEIRSFLGDDEDNGSKSIAEFPLLTKNAVESLRYRAEVIY